MQEKTLEALEETQIDTCGRFNKQTKLGLQPSACITHALPPPPTPLNAGARAVHKNITSQKTNLFFFKYKRQRVLYQMLPWQKVAVRQAPRALSVQGLAEAASQAYAAKLSTAGTLNSVTKVS